MALRQSLLTRGIAPAPEGADLTSPADERNDAKNNMLKAMRPLPTQHYWNVYFDRPQGKDPKKAADGNYEATLEQLAHQIESVQDFWRYNNNTPVDQIKMRESIYLFKQGFQPIWEDRRNINGGSWTFRVPKASGPDFWTRVQLMAIGEKLQGCLDTGDQLCGVGLSVRFNSHLISVWHRESSKQKSVDAILATVLEELPDELKPRPDNYFYKKHSDHAGFKAPADAEATEESSDKK
ncbi:hypothetical protein V495_05932 [Pseudogymnoascus sp. VKM F-4514 (FW-929)]|nr:hypothetical protein V490_01544 [Pseudogymnoascus sp. VKM F-3557]KFY39472.1 hypothetical protein V495_05932 [Pseudogymnoascus sp. VKM F-4514 (FW-929)]KFY61966.1 hypothetical protein V497_02670 [Pseudogymnoascus sp. VKM F-4516 (FW-969)]